MEGSPSRVTYWFSERMCQDFYPYAIALVGAGACWWLGVKFPSSELVLTATLTASGIFVGFLSTSKSILLTLNSELVEDLRRAGYLRVLVSYIRQAIWSNLLFCFINVVGFFIDRADNAYVVVWLLSGIVAMLCFIRVTNIMLKIFEVESDHNEAE